MSYYEFKPNDLFVNTIEAYPDVSFYVQSGDVYINDRSFITSSAPEVTGAFREIGVSKDYISLYEYNINRSPSQNIYPFVVKSSGRQNFKRFSDSHWATQYNYDGEKVTGSYNLSASISRGVYSYTTAPTSDSKYRHLKAIRNTINHYRYLSPKFDYDAYYDAEDSFSGAYVNMINIPSIFYGSSIKKGSVNLKFYVSGTMAAQASDTRYNGELIQVSGNVNGGVIGTILYKEGIILLTGSSALGTAIYFRNGNNAVPRWTNFGDTLPVFGTTHPQWPLGVSPTVASATGSYAIEFQGTVQKQTMTMFAKAPYSELNHSNNPTYLKNSAKSLSTVISGAYRYSESPRYLVNIVDSNYTDVKPPMSKETYISKIALYDKDKNVIGYAKLATPIRKTEDREFNFKLKLDL